MGRDFVGMVYIYKFYCMYVGCRCILELSCFSELQLLVLLTPHSFLIIYFFAVSLLGRISMKMDMPALTMSSRSVSS